MKALCFSLVAALCLGLASSLNCYNCTTTGDNCLVEATCNATMNETVCRTMVTKTSGQTELVKSCGINCTESNVENLQYFACCSSDLCNKVSGSTSISASAVTLALGISALLAGVLI